ncbi:hypothetical protein C4K03_4750 [Pseudomonas synxantha]|uniref:HrpE/YscL family type III secretion apparatus protein n=1 Tax=Pseudomonas synxantha TaxID=47883 RepID=A0A3G7UE96_9PSED|nr:HrpE/YscL family type III secretion apparatus protein [Pseudomonas synxantha]AZE56888.1 hypothetical protein C4K03_4750 [Pseudomonas synxantha]
MWVKRRITSHSSQPLLMPAVLTREHLKGFELAAAVLRQAQARAESERKHEAALANEAHAAFLQSTLACSLAREQMFQEQVRDYQQAAVRLVNQALHLLLVQVPPAERIEGLLEQLFERGSTDANVQVYCHPNVQSLVRKWLDQHPDCHWDVVTNIELPEDALYVDAGAGELHINWNACVAQLLLPESACVEA